MLRRKELKSIAQISEKEALLIHKTAEIQRRIQMFDELIREADFQIAQKKSQLNGHHVYSANEVSPFYHPYQAVSMSQEPKKKKKRMPRKQMLQKLGRDVKEIIQALQNS